jgi:hypothetical protein
LLRYQQQWWSYGQLPSAMAAASPMAFLVAMASFSKKWWVAGIEFWHRPLVDTMHALWIMGQWGVFQLS